MTPFFHKSIQQYVHLTRRLQRDMELTEALSWKPFFHGFTKTKESHALSDTLLGAIPELDDLTFNRVVGLGMSSLVLDSQIDEIISHFDGLGSRSFMIQLSPFVIPDTTHELLEYKGFRHEHNWTKLLWSKNFYLEERPSIFKVKSLEHGKEDVYADIILSSFGWPELLRSALISTIHQPGFSHHLVWDGDQAIAAGASFYYRNFASLLLSGTLPSHRNLGAHQLLMKTKIQEARNKGCEWITAETAALAKDQKSVAYRNLRKLGFEEAYERRNFVYRF